MEERAAGDDAGSSSGDCTGPQCIPPGKQAGDIDITSSPYDCSTQSQDNGSCIQSALDAAASAKTGIYIPDGSYQVNATLKVGGVRVDGNGTTSILNFDTASTPNGSQHGIETAASGFQIANIEVTTSYANGRSPVNHPCVGTTSAVGVTSGQVDHVYCHGYVTGKNGPMGNQTGQGAGIFFGYTTVSSGILITNNTVDYSQADCIGMYQGASNIVVDSNLIEYCGDDGISNVTYAGGNIVTGNLIQNNVVIGNNWGRNFTAVGAENIDFKNNYAIGNGASASCLYIGQDSVAGTVGSNNITWTHGTLDGTTSYGNWVGSLD